MGCSSSDNSPKSPKKQILMNANAPPVQYIQNSPSMVNKNPQEPDNMELDSEDSDSQDPSRKQNKGLSTISKLYEIMNIHLGGMGVKIGEIIWEDICVENGIDDNGMYQFHPQLKHDGTTLHSYFRETNKGTFVPRTVFFDMDPESLNYLRGRSLKQVFDDKGLLLGQQDTTGFFSSGFHSNGPAYLDTVKEYIRSEIEACDNFNGFMLYNSITGGCSSGFCSLLSQTLTDEFSNKRKIGFNLYPSLSRSTNPKEYFNTILAHDR